MTTTKKTETKSKREYRIRCSRSCFNTGTTGNFRIEVYEPRPFEFPWRTVESGLSYEAAAARIEELSKEGL